jgi:large subunit ribosomal protein L22|nr:50S ribosomal protein L22, large subunit ribosomal protein L22 [uncultured archaeon]
MRTGEIIMPKWGYSIIEETLNPEKTAKASGRELKVSHKAAREVCKAIKGMNLSYAKEYLRDVIAKKKAIPYTRYTKKLGHKGGLQKNCVGRYPMKTAHQILQVLQAAEANAENKGLDVDRLRIMHAAAYQGIKLKRFMPRAHGRASPKFDTTTHVEIVLDEKPSQGEQ